MTTTTLELAQEFTTSVPGWQRPRWADHSLMDGDVVIHSRRSDTCFAMSLTREDTLSMDDALAMTVSIGEVQVILPDSSAVCVAEATALHAALGDLLDQIGDADA